MDHIAVVGTGYVGLVSGACLAEVGYTVLCLDIDQQKIARLQQGEIPIFEPSLEQMVLKNSSEGRLLFTCDYNEAVAGATIAVLAVDTPTGKDGLCDRRNIERAAAALADSMTGPLVVVIKSTVPVGTSAHVGAIIRRRLATRKVDYTVDIVSNPEFLREGAAVHDFMHPDRIVIGVSNERAEEIMRDLYRPFRHSQDKFIVMDPASSELTKYAANTMLACRISYMNWISRLCDATGADIESVRIGIGSDSRIGPSFLRAGIGFGGSCFPKDVRALRGMALEHNVPCAFIEAIETTNEEQKHILSQKIIATLEAFAKLGTRICDAPAMTREPIATSAVAVATGEERSALSSSRREQIVAPSFAKASLEQKGGIKDATVAIFGLSFKPDTDDMREAPSLCLIKELVAAGARVRLFDPVAMDKAKRLTEPSESITWCQNLWDAASGADAVAIATEWSCFKEMDLLRLKACMRTPILFDGRNIFSPEDISGKGFFYFSIGRPTPRFSVECEPMVAQQGSQHNPTCSTL